MLPLNVILLDMIFICGLIVVVCVAVISISLILHEKYGDVPIDDLPWILRKFTTEIKHG